MGRFISVAPPVLQVGVRYGLVMIAYSNSSIIDSYTFYKIFNGIFLDSTQINCYVHLL